MKYLIYIVLFIGAAFLIHYASKEYMIGRIIFYKDERIGEADMRELKKLSAMKLYELMKDVRKEYVRKIEIER